MVRGVALTPGLNPIAELAPNVDKSGGIMRTESD